MPAPDLTLAEAAAQLRDGRLTSVALTQAHLDRIAAVDPDLRSVVAIDADRALAAAAAADAALSQGRDLGPLHGIPLAIKDMIDMAGLPTLCGSRAADPTPARADAAVVARLRQAGAVLLGKLATYEFALVGPTFDGPAPPAVNPWSADHVTGGSSSGPAAAVAAGLVRTAIGTDTGGSVRSPAAWCGVVGLKPTFGLVAMNGTYPLSPSLDHIGIIAATVAEAAAVLDAIATPGHAPATAMMGQGIAGLRIGYARRWFADDPALDPRVLAAVDDAVAVLSQLGARITLIDLPEYPRFEAAGITIIDGESHAIHAAGLAADASRYGASARQALAPGAAVTEAELSRAKALAAALRDEVDTTVFARHDAIVTATTLTPAPPVAPYRTGTAGWSPMRTLPFNLTGHPALSVPAGFAGGLPTGIQIVAPAQGEAMACRVGAAFEVATDHALQRPPGRVAPGTRDG